jgi:beta-glucosidase/6-phospho-beta-glucosidase/beta-galactosidase
MEEYVAAEKRRWEITLKHWDQPMKVMDPYEEPFSVFLPIGGACK